MGMESVKKIGTLLSFLKKSLLSGQKYNRPMQARPYTKDFEKNPFSGHLSSYFRPVKVPLK